MSSDVLGFSSYGTFTALSAGADPVRIRTIVPELYLEAGGGDLTINGDFSASGNSGTLQGNALSFSTETATQLVATIPAGSAASAADLVITNAEAQTNTLAGTDVGGFSYVEAPGTPILTNIEAQMVTIIEAMTTVAGFQFTWGTANQPDKALQDAAMVAEIYLQNEDNLDEPDGVDSNSYLNAVFFEIKVQSTNTALAATPIFGVNAIHNKALDDLKKAFGTNYHLNNTANSIMYRNSTREVLPAGDLFTPGVMTSIWRVDYAQDREDVTVNANT